MDLSTPLSLDAKLADLQGTIRSMKEENMSLKAALDLLQQEKEILLNALNDFTEMEITMDETRTRNIQLESQLASLASTVASLKNS